MANGKKILVIVMGDVNYDVHVVAESSDANKIINVHEIPAGAWQLYKLIDSLFPGKKGNISVLGQQELSHTVKLPKCIFKWENFEVDEKKDQIWRWRRALGYSPRAEDKAEDYYKMAKLRKRPTTEFDNVILILDEKQYGFRDSVRIWKCTIKKYANKIDYVLFRTRGQVDNNSLLEYLKNLNDGSNHKLIKKTLLFVTTDDLRRAGYNLREGCSWESLFVDLASSFGRDNSVNSDMLKDVLGIIVYVDCEGAIFVKSHNDGNGQKAHWVIDLEASEGHWDRTKLGSVNGSTYCMVAGVTYQFVETLLNSNKTSKDSEIIIEGLKRGLRAMRKLRNGGFDINNNNVTFPYNGVKNCILNDKSVNNNDYGISVDEMDFPEQKDNFTFLSRVKKENWHSLIKNIVWDGVVESCKKYSLPYATFGKYVTMDREEIDSLRLIKGIIKGYLERNIDRKKEKPLSLATFGNPGDGKSFSVKEIAKEIGINEGDILSFNLSQWPEEPSYLAKAFHRIRDKRLLGAIPLVIWDEFDTKLYFWLRYFLMPMQDGTFDDDYQARPIGKAVFIFTGGVNKSMGELLGRIQKDKEKSEEEQNGPSSEAPKGPAQVDGDLRAAKVPDFISRLNGYIDVPTIENQEKNTIGYQVRKAIVLRALLEKHAGHLFKEKTKGNIDEDVIRSFIDFDYKHGVRSMESILLTCRLAGNDRFRKSAFPSIDQLKLHVENP